MKEKNEKKNIIQTKKSVCEKEKRPREWTFLLL